jgi:predicted signal transduction protein with EAL and GGDEF domain
VLARFGGLPADAQEVVRLVAVVPTRAELWLVEAAARYRPPHGRAAAPARHTGPRRGGRVPSAPAGPDASIGVAAYPDHAAGADELLQRADVAMYAAKAAHLCYVVYDPTLDRHSPRRLGLLGQLRRALAAGELVVQYQPKADVRSGRIIGVEALMRWQHPEHGLLGLGEFVRLAETTGLIRPLTSYVLEAALRQCRAWLEAGRDLSVA